MKIIIREFDNNDIQAITNIFNEIVDEGNAFLSEFPMTTAEMEYRIKNQEIATYVAVSGEEVCGCYMVRPNLKGRGNHIANATYFVTKSFRGQGIGYQLGKHSLKKAKEFGFKAMQFNSVVVQNKASVNLWKKLGFEKIGIIPKGFRLLNENFVDITIFYKKL